MPTKPRQLLPGKITKLGGQRGIVLAEAAVADSHAAERAAFSIDGRALIRKAEARVAWIGGTPVAFSAPGRRIASRGDK